MLGGDGERRLGATEELDGRAGEHAATVLDHDQPVADLLDLAQEVRGHEHRAVGRRRGRRSAGGSHACRRDRGRSSARRGRAARDRRGGHRRSRDAASCPSSTRRKRSPARSARPTCSSTAGIREGSRPPMAASTREVLGAGQPRVHGWSLDRARRRAEEGGGRVERAPSTAPSPDVGATSPSSIAIVVVLPAPFGPMNPATTPRGSSKLRSSTAARSPYRLVSPVDRHGRGNASCCHGSSIRRSALPVVALVWRSRHRGPGPSVRTALTQSQGQNWPRNPRRTANVRQVWTRPFW